MRSILVYRHGGIGDTVLMSPVLQSLRCRFPDSEICFAGHPGRVFLLDGPPNAHRVISSEGPLWRRLYSGIDTASGEVRSFLESFDRIIIYGLSTGERIRQLGLADDRLRVYPAIPPMDWESSAISFYVSGLEEFGVGKTVRNPVISPLGDESFFPVHGEKEGEFLAIHPGAGSANKRFNLSWYLHLASEVKKALQMEVLFMLGPAEVEIGWDCRIKDNGFSVVSIPRLRSATLWLSGSACFIGNDCGLAHISAALGIPTVVFFRNSDPGVWAPAGNKVLVCDTRQGYGLDYFLAMVGKFLGSDDEN